MSALHPVLHLLTLLPARVRAVLYWIAVALGILVGVCEALGVVAVGPVEVADVKSVLLVVGPVLGITAAANLAAPTAVASGRDEHEAVADVVRTLAGDLSNGRVAVTHVKLDGAQLSATIRRERGTGGAR